MFRLNSANVCVSNVFSIHCVLLFFQTALPGIHPTKLGGVTHDGKLWKKYATDRYTYLRSTPPHQRSDSVDEEL